MRRFDTDQIGSYFGPRRPIPLPGPVFHPPLQRAQYSHIQVIPNAADSSKQHKNASPAVTFRRPSYSEEVEQSMAAAASSMPPTAPASLANITSGTTFAAKARQAELNAARARKSEERGENRNEDILSRMPEAFGAVTLSRPRNKGKGWKPLNLDEIPEAISESGSTHHDSNQPLTAVKSNSTSNEPIPHGPTHYPQHPHPVAHQVRQSEYQPQLLPVYHHTQEGHQTRLMNPEQHAYQMQQLNYLALQRNVQLHESHVPNFAPTLQPSVHHQQSPPTISSQSQLVVDDPFVDPDPGNEPARSSTPFANGMMNSEFKFPTDQQEQHVSGSNQRPATVVATYQRDPKPYSSFVPSTDHTLHKEKHQQNLQQVSNNSPARASLQSSTRTVLYDPITRHAFDTTANINIKTSQSTNDYVPYSTQLAGRDRAADIYNARSHASMISHLPSTEQSAALESTSVARAGKDRLEETEKWWKYDGRGQQQVRAYLEQVVDQHKYRNSKRSLERQANFRDDRSDITNSTTRPEASDEIISRLLIPVIGNLRNYGEEAGYFNKFTPAPAWAVDSSADGNRSFFGEDWGKRPSRVGRDPRYRPTFHEGRYTVFEPNDGRVSGRGW
ncbi:MAG: hypothetical protein Q9220_006951 [cf. Caloplaca sp. 1 TL-2023]